MCKYLEVNAGGGLVTNPDGKFLLIFRNGKWDRPKGHQEPEEPIEDTAVREVEEETGLHGLELGRLLCITDHTYFRDGRWHLKHTWWYSMSLPEECMLIPQTEEGIAEARWVEESELYDLLKNTYPTIVKVFQAAGISEKFMPEMKQNSENLV